MRIYQIDEDINNRTVGIFKKLIKYRPPSIRIKLYFKLFKLFIKYEIKAYIGPKENYLTTKIIIATNINSLNSHLNTYFKVMDIQMLNNHYNIQMTYTF